MTTHACLRLLWTFAAGGSLLACGGSDTTGPKIHRDIMWSVASIPKALCLAVNDSFQLDAKPLDYYGNVITDDVAIKYMSSDTSMFTVDSTGVLRAHRSTNGQFMRVDITVRAGQVTKFIYMIVSVIPTPVRIDSISVKPQFGEPVLTIGGIGSIQGRALDSAGNTVPGVITYLETADGSLGYTLLFGTVFVVAPWKGYIKSSLFVNGRLLIDSVYYRTRYRDAVNVTVARNTVNSALAIKFANTYNTNIYISPNGQATFVNNLTTPMDVTFERPDSIKGSADGAAGGNIISLAPRGRARRWFPALGDYFFTIRSGSDSSRVSITVKDMPE